jgi:hypothetical protein
VGEHLEFLCTGAWSILVGVAMTQSIALHLALGIAGIVIGAILVLCSFAFVGQPSGVVTSLVVVVVVFPPV